MAQKQGLQIFSANGKKMFELTDRLSKYLGEVDIYPTSSSADCDGVLPTPTDIEQYDVRPYCILQKVYASNISFSGEVHYVLPEVMYTRIDGRYYIRWAYINNSIYSSQVNLPVRVRYGFF